MVSAKFVVLSKRNIFLQFEEVIFLLEKSNYAYLIKKLQWKELGI